MTGNHGAYDVNDTRALLERAFHGMRDVHGESTNHFTLEAHWYAYKAESRFFRMIPSMDTILKFGFFGDVGYDNRFVFFDHAPHNAFAPKVSCVSFDIISGRSGRFHNQFGVVGQKKHDSSAKHPNLFLQYV